MTEYILWLDCETTGLSAQHDHLLEVAAVLTNKDATKEYGTYENVIYYPEVEVQEIKKRTVDFVLGMHTKTGLWDRLPDGEYLDVVDEELLSFVKSVSPEPRKTRLAGNSVRLDLNFAEKYLPMTYSHLHYRSIDVSALAYTLDTSWGVVDGVYHKEKKHTAIDDIRESIAEFHWLRDSVKGLEYRSLNSWPQE